MTDDLVAVTIPAVGVAMTEAAILRWLVAVGDDVTEGQHVAEVETDKVVMELESPATGIVTEILIEPGVNVEVNVPVATIRLSGSIARNPAEPPLQGAVVVHVAAAEEPSLVTSSEPLPAPAARVVAPEPASVPAPKPAVSRAPFREPPRVRFSDRHVAPVDPSAATNIAPESTSVFAPHGDAGSPWLIVSEMRASGLERSLAELRRTRAGTSVTYTDLLVSALARAAVHAFVDRTVITSVAVTDERVLQYREISDASSLSPEGISRVRPRGSSGSAPTATDALHLIIVNAGPTGGDVIVPPQVTPPDAIVVGVGSIAPRVIAVGTGVSVQSTVHISVSAPPHQVTPRQVSRFVSTLEEKLRSA